MVKFQDERTAVLAVLRDGIALSDEVLGATRTHFLSQVEAKNDELVAATFGLKGRSGLIAVLAIANQAVDDQAAIIARTMSDAVINLRYLRVPTVRRLKSGNVFLRTIDKEELFLSSAALAEQRLRGEMRMIPAEELDRANALRARLRLTGESNYWHCSSCRALVDELKSAKMGEQEAKALDNAYEIFRFASQAVHPTPLADYLRPGPSGHWPPVVQSECVETATIAMCAVLGLDLVRVWGQSVKLDIERRAAGLLSQLMAD